MNERERINGNRMIPEYWKFVIACVQELPADPSWIGQEIGLPQTALDRDLTKARCTE
jgi:hypothetical protein